MVTYFRGLLDVFSEIVKQCPPEEAAASGAAAATQRLPGRDWQGWEGIADLLGVQADASAFRAREAVKIALASDHLNLSGQLVDWAVLEQRLEGILAGAVTLTQLPDTEEDLRRQAPPRAIILYADSLQKSRRRAGAGMRNYLVVLEGEKQEEEGEWFSHEELKRHFPNFREMISEFEARCKDQQRLQQAKQLPEGQAKGGSLTEATTNASDPPGQAAGTTAADKSVAAGAGAGGHPKEPQQQQQQRREEGGEGEHATSPGRPGEGALGGLSAQRAPSHMVSTDGLPARTDAEAALSSAGKRAAPAAPAAVPGGSSVPRLRQPQPQPLLGREGDRAPASMMLAGVGLGPSPSRLQEPPPTARPKGRPGRPAGPRPTKPTLLEGRGQQRAMRQIIHPAAVGITQLTLEVDPVCRGQINERMVVVPPCPAAASAGRAAPRSPGVEAAQPPSPPPPQTLPGPARLSSEQQRPPRKLPPLLAAAAAAARAAQPVGRPTAADPHLQQPWQRDGPAPSPIRSPARPQHRSQQLPSPQAGAAGLLPLRGPTVHGQAARDGLGRAVGLCHPAPPAQPSWPQTAAAALQQVLPPQPPAPQELRPALGLAGLLPPANGLLAAFARPAAVQPPAAVALPAAPWEGPFGAPQPAPPPAPAAAAGAPDLNLHSLHPLLHQQLEYVRCTGKLPGAAPAVLPEQQKPEGLDALLQLLPKPRGASVASPPGPQRQQQPFVAAQALPRPIQQQQQQQQYEFAPAAAPPSSLSGLLPQLQHPAAVLAPGLVASPRQEAAWRQPYALASVQQQQEQQQWSGAYPAANIQPTANVHGRSPHASPREVEAERSPPLRATAAAISSLAARPAAAAMPSPHACPQAAASPPLAAARLRSPPAVQEERPVKRTRVAEPAAAMSAGWGQRGAVSVGQQQAGQADAAPSPPPAAAAAAAAAVPAEAGAAASAAAAAGRGVGLDQGPAASRDPGWSTDAEPDEQQQLGAAFLRRRAPNKAPNPAGGAQLREAEEESHRSLQDSEGGSRGLGGAEGTQGREEIFYDAAEEIVAQPSAGPDATGPSAAAWVQRASLDLRTQPDEVQWTAADAAGLVGLFHTQPQQQQQQQQQHPQQQQEHTQQQQVLNTQPQEPQGMEAAQEAGELRMMALHVQLTAVPPTQVVKQEPYPSESTDAQAQQAKQLITIPDTEEEAAQLAEEAQQQAEQAQQEQQRAAQARQDMLIEDLLEPEPWATATIKGAKNRGEGVELYIEWRWEGGWKDIVPSWRLLGRVHCMETLIRFYESKSKKHRGDTHGKGSSRSGGAG